MSDGELIEDLIRLRDKLTGFADRDLLARAINRLEGACPACHGAGEIIVNETMPRDPQWDRPVQCRECGGSGEA